MAQGASVAAVFTTVPAVTERLHLDPLVTTATLVAVAMTAGVGSFAGLAAMRRVGPVGTMRLALLTVVALLLLLGWAPDGFVAVCAYLGFGFALGALDVSANSRAAEVERCYGRSVFGSFYAAWSVAGVLAALLTAGAAWLGWPVALVLTAQAGVVLPVALGIRRHTLPGVSAVTAAQPAPLGRRLWARLIPLGVALMIVYVIDSTISAWSTVYLRQTLATSLSAAPLAYAAYQVGTVVGRSITDRCVQLLGATAVVRSAALLIAGALVGLSLAPGWPFAVAAAGLVGLGTSTLAPLCLASAARLHEKAPEPILARLNLFNYVGVITGGAASGLLGSSGHFRLAFAIPAILAIPLLVGSRHFTTPHTPRTVPVEGTAGGA
jgi:MFS family permease